MRRAAAFDMPKSRLIENAGVIRAIDRMPKADAPMRRYKIGIAISAIKTGMAKLAKLASALCRMLGCGRTGSAASTRMFTRRDQPPRTRRNRRVVDRS